ncbi:hypothetical protein [Estrella lausannensis]|uniref:Putative membrane protein n=1 Tax=Estrella lausannensis TaxID=483423 RepID=A0A0H5DPN0_9BACT|nr:hypothetical protein [Estrella lausannensis]CRX38531.1 putative membrane protein [Estrella lausannensis]
MASVIDFKDLPKHLNYKIVALESVDWNGKKVSVITLSSRQSSLVERIIDLFLLILIAVPTMGAGLAFPFAVEIQKSVLKGRKHMYHIRRSTLPKLDFKKADGSKSVLMGTEGRQLSLRLEPQNSTQLRSRQDSEYKETVGDLAELGLQDDEIVGSMDGSGIAGDTILLWAHEYRRERQVSPELKPQEGAPRKRTK